MTSGTGSLSTYVLRPSDIFGIDDITIHLALSNIASVLPKNRRRKPTSLGWKKTCWGVGVIWSSDGIRGCSGGPAAWPPFPGGLISHWQRALSWTPLTPQGERQKVSSSDYLPSQWSHRNAGLAKGISVSSARLYSRQSALEQQHLSQTIALQGCQYRLSCSSNIANKKGMRAVVFWYAEYLNGIPCSFSYE